MLMGVFGKGNDFIEFVEFLYLSSDAIFFRQKATRSSMTIVRLNDKL